MCLCMLFYDYLRNILFDYIEFSVYSHLQRAFSIIAHIERNGLSICFTVHKYILTFYLFYAFLREEKKNLFFSVLVVL